MVAFTMVVTVLGLFIWADRILWKDTLKEYDDD
jgi:hypothetical protein